MMNHAIEAGRSDGAITAWAESSNLNYYGIEVYKRLGFAICGFDSSLYRGTTTENEFAIFLSREL